MAAENALAFLRAAQAERRPPAVILISGPQVFVREYVLDSIRRLLAAKGFQYLSFQIGAGDDFSGVLGEIGAGELFAPHRMLACRVLRSRRAREESEEESAEQSDDGAGGAGRASGSASGEAALASAIEANRIPPHLVMLYDRDNAPARIRRAVEHAGLIINCPRPFDDQLGQYARIFARELGLALPANSAEMLISRYGSDLSAIANALSKAAIYADSKEPLVQEGSAAAAPRAPELFDLAQRVSTGRAAEALGVLERALASGRDPLEILGVELVPVIRRMMIAAAMGARRSTTGEIASALGMPPQGRLASEAIEGGRRLGLVRLQDAHRRLCEVDAGIKGGTIKEGAAALHGLLIELLAPPSFES